MLLLLKRILILTSVELLWIPVLFFFCVVMMYDGDNLTKSQRMLRHKYKPEHSAQFGDYEDDDNDINYEYSKHFMNEPKAKNYSDYPTIVWWTKYWTKSRHTIDCPNDRKCEVFSKNNTLLSKNVGAYLFHALGLDYMHLPLPRQPEKIIWGVWYEETPKYVTEMLYEKTLSVFNYSSTYSRYSDVPFPLQFLGSLESITDKTHYVETPAKNSYLRELSPVLYIQSNCDDTTERDAYVDKLMEYIRIDCYGTCRQNKRLPPDLRGDYLNILFSEKFLRFTSRYKFVIAIENAVCEDYVTEKFWRPIKAGSVPIYFGSPSIRDWFPNNKSAILIEDFPTPKLMSEHIKNLQQNDDLYEEYLEHKTKGIISNKRLLAEVKKRPNQVKYDGFIREFTFECFICENLYARKSNPDKQEIHIVNKSHLNCPKPISALTLKENNSSRWSQIWTGVEVFANNIHKTVLTGNYEHIFDTP